MIKYSSACAPLCERESFECYQPVLPTSESSIGFTQERSPVLSGIKPTVSANADSSEKSLRDFVDLSKINQLELAKPNIERLRSGVETSYNNKRTSSNNDLMEMILKVRKIVAITPKLSDDLCPENWATLISFTRFLSNDLISYLPQEHLNMSINLSSYILFLVTHTFEMKLYQLRFDYLKFLYNHFHSSSSTDICIYNLLKLFSLTKK